METDVLEITLPISLEQARAEYDEAMRMGDFNPDTTFDDYLELLAEREHEKRMPNPSDYCQRSESE